MKDYRVAVAFWRNGIEQKVDDVIRMTVAEAKYLGHVVTEEVTKVVQAVAPKKSRAPAAAPVLGVSVEEKPDVDSAN
jgi:hypothetical protein